MRTTLNLDEDILDQARRLAEKEKKPFRLVLNEALRLGLEDWGQHSQKKPYVTHPHALKLRPGFSLDNIGELLAEVEGENSR